MYQALLNIDCYYEQTKTAAAIYYAQILKLCHITSNLFYLTLRFY